MSFIYPRTIAITRPAAQVGYGAVGYGGEMSSEETSVACDVQASIQLKKEGSAPDARLPGDVSKRPFWNIIFVLPNGTVNRQDIITDDLGIRYQVQANYWNSLGYTCFCEELES